MGAKSSPIRVAIIEIAFKATNEIWKKQIFCEIKKSIKIFASI